MAKGHIALYGVGKFGKANYELAAQAAADRATARNGGPARSPAGAAGCR